MIHIMKYLVSLGLGLFMLSIMKAQQISTLEVTYKYVNTGSNISSEAKLYTSSQASLFIFEKKANHNEEVDVNEEGEIKVTIGGPDEQGKKIYKNFADQKLIFRDFLYIDGKTKVVIVEEKLPALNWNLKEQTKEIGKYNCSLAEVTFRGRTYEVWYTTEIPIQNGPWKFQGLPGLILEVKSRDNNIYFLLENLKMSSGGMIIDAPKDGEPITFDNYVEIKEKTIDNFIARLYSKLPRGTKITSNPTENHSLEKDFSENER